MSSNDNSTVDIKVKLVGIFRVLSGESQLLFSLKEPATVRDAVESLIERFPNKFRKALMDPVLGEVWPNALLLVNGREISVREGLGTIIGDGDRLVFIPVAHGG